MGIRSNFSRIPVILLVLARIAFRMLSETIIKVNVFSVENLKDIIDNLTPLKLSGGQPRSAYQCQSVSDCVATVDSTVNGQDFTDS